MFRGYGGPTAKDEGLGRPSSAYWADMMLRGAVSEPVLEADDRGRRRAASAGIRYYHRLHPDEAARRLGINRPSEAS